MDIGKIKAMGWAPQIDLRTGLASAYQDYLEFLACKAKAA